jgi:hydroxymethylpyrimidine/phosphomethylpyrimidine kinase
LEDARLAARRIFELGPRAVLIKGGHFVHTATDLLFDGTTFLELPSERILTPHTHGTGCTYSAATAACLALGQPLSEAVARAKRFITEAIRTNPGLGAGQGPVNHFATVS